MMKLKKLHIRTIFIIVFSLLCIVFTAYLPISIGLLQIKYLQQNPSLVNSIEDYIKAIAMFIIVMATLFYIYKNHRHNINKFIKQHFLIIKGFGVLYVAILAIVPVLKSSVATYWQITPFHHIFIYLVIIIIFFCVFISSFDEAMMSKQFKISELLVCFLLCLMGLVLFVSLMEANT